MHVAIDARILAASHTGSANYLRNLLRAAHDIAAEHEYVLIAQQRDVAVQLGEGGHWTVVAAPEAHLGNASWEQTRLVELLEWLEPEVFISPTLTLPLLRVCPQMVIVFDLGFERFPEFYVSVQRAYLKHWVPPSVRVADAVVTLSDFGRRELSGTYGCDPGRITVIPGAADERFHPLPHEATAWVFHKYGLQAPYLLCVASLEKNKNLERLVAAFAAARAESAQDWSLVLAGRPGGATQAVLSAVSGCGLDGAIKLLGPIPDQELPALYNAAEAFAFPSLYEGFGLPPIEAMACGTPALVSDAASVPEIVGNGALVVNAESTSDLAVGLFRLMSDASLRQCLSAKGLEWTKRYSWRSSAQRLLGLLDRISIGQEGVFA